MRVDKDHKNDMFENQQLDMTCTADRAFPQAEIRFYLNKERVEFDKSDFKENFEISIND